MNAVKMPAARIRYDGWKIETGRVVVAVRGALADREEQHREQHDARDDHQQRREPVDVEHDAERDRPASDRHRDRLVADIDDHEQRRRDDADDRERHDRDDDLGAAVADPRSVRSPRRAAEGSPGAGRGRERCRSCATTPGGPRSSGVSTGASSRTPAKSRLVMIVIGAVSTPTKSVVASSSSSSISVSSSIVSSAAVVRWRTAMSASSSVTVSAWPSCHER